MCIIVFFKLYCRFLFLTLTHSLSVPNLPTTPLIHSKFSSPSKYFQVCQFCLSLLFSAIMSLHTYLWMQFVFQRECAGLCWQLGVGAAGRGRRGRRVGAARRRAGAVGSGVGGLLRHHGAPLGRRRARATGRCLLRSYIRLG